MTGWRFREDIVELGHVSDHRLLVWFGGIDICKKIEEKLALLFARNTQQVSRNEARRVKYVAMWITLGF